ncbi:hypothetical protein [Gelidibacter sediminis]|nr:hypothetical protein [Gelidibacter sediminis]
MRSLLKFGFKSVVALFAIGVGTKLGKDAINDLKQFQDNRKHVDNGRNR